MNSKIKRNALKNEDVKEKLEQIYYVQKVLQLYNKIGQQNKSLQIKSSIGIKPEKVAWLIWGRKKRYCDNWCRRE